MALLVKERKALEQLEQSFEMYFQKVYGTSADIDSSKSVEERMLYLSVLLDTSY